MIFINSCIWNWIRIMFYLFSSLINWLQMFYALKSEDEREMCARTIYCTNIDKKVVSNVHYFLNGFMPVWSIARAIIYGLFGQLIQVTQADVKLFFESVCGEVCSFSCDLSYKCCFSHNSFYDPLPNIVFLFGRFNAWGYWETTIIHLVLLLLS